MEQLVTHSRCGPFLLQMSLKGYGRGLVYTDVVIISLYEMHPDTVLGYFDTVIKRMVDSSTRLM